MHLLMLLLIHSDAGPSRLFQVSARIVNVLVRRRPVVHHNVVVVIVTGVLRSSVLEQRRSPAVVYGGPLSATLAFYQRHLAQLIVDAVIVPCSSLTYCIHQVCSSEQLQSDKIHADTGWRQLGQSKVRFETTREAWLRTLTADTSHLKVHNTNEPSFTK